MPEDDVKEFAYELNRLIASYAGRISNAECIGIMTLMIHDISDNVRKSMGTDPHPLS